VKKQKKKRCECPACERDKARTELPTTEQMLAEIAECPERRALMAPMEAAFRKIYGGGL
jgi:hypothetical protein